MVGAACAPGAGDLGALVELPAGPTSREAASPSVGRAAEPGGQPPTQSRVAREIPRVSTRAQRTPTEDRRSRWLVAKAIRRGSHAGHTDQSAGTTREQARVISIAALSLSHRAGTNLRRLETLAAPPEQARRGPGLGRSHPGEGERRESEAVSWPVQMDTGRTAALLLANRRTLVMSVSSPAPRCSRYSARRSPAAGPLPEPTARCRRWILGGCALSRGKGLVRARRAPDGARRAVVRLAWLRVVDGSADAVGDRVAGVLVEPAGL